MINIGQRTRIDPGQIQLERLFSVARVLASRGFIVKEEGDGSDTLLAKTAWTMKEANTVFDVFNNHQRRKELRDYIHSKSISPSNAVHEVCTLDGFIKDQKRFSHTFEWYLGELLKRRFGAFSSSYGVVVSDICRNSDDGKSGDFDVLAVLGDMNLLYIECKSGATREDEISKAIERGISLHCIATVIVVENLPESMLEKISKFKYPNLQSTTDLYRINIKGHSKGEVYKWFNCYFVCASPNIEGKLKTVLRLIEYSRISISHVSEPSESSYNNMGYTLTKIGSPNLGLA